MIINDKYLESALVYGMDLAAGGSDHRLVHTQRQKIAI